LITELCKYRQYQNERIGRQQQQQKKEIYRTN
jgi:hypothetical protein